MKTRFMFTAVLSLLMLSSCTTFQKIFTSKRLKDCVTERDWLKTQYVNLKADTMTLHAEIRQLKEDYGKISVLYQKSVKDYTELNRLYNDLNGKYNNLEKKYNDLSNSTLNKTEQLNLALKNKTDELRSKERILEEREKKLKELQDIIKNQDSITNALTARINEALTGFKTDELNVNIKNGKVYVSMMDKLLFKSGSITVETKGVDALKKLAAVLLKNADIEILVEGHTDNVPIKTAVYKDNWDLSVARATSIVRILSEDFKVPATRLTASGRGEFFPIASNETVEGKAKNRRTEIILSPKLDQLYNMLNQAKK